MRGFKLMGVLFFVSWAVLSQEGFVIPSNKNKVEIPFKLINNLIFIPITVNGVTLNFLLDSGVEETLLFSLDESQSLNLKNVEKIQLRGLGSEESIEGLKSTNNEMFSCGLVAHNQLFYVVLDPSFNLSSHIGIPVNGIIGAQFFKNNVIQIDYIKKKITVLKPGSSYLHKIERSYVRLPISIERGKPYFQTKLLNDGNLFEAKMLIDIGNSDAVWVFQNDNHSIKIPRKNFDDFLGKGFSGDILGKRAILKEVTIASFKFLNPIVSFPDSSSLKYVKVVQGRVGSIGGEIFRRFKLVLDYQNGSMFLKKNSHYASKFKYNRSGIEIEQRGMKWVEGLVRVENSTSNLNSASATNVNKSDGWQVTSQVNNFKVKFELKPNYFIGGIRKNSAAEKCGLKKDDEIISINGIPVYRYSLEKINALFSEDSNKNIAIVVVRQEMQLKFSFQLESEL